MFFRARQCCSLKKVNKVLEETAIFVIKTGIYNEDGGRKFLRNVCFSLAQ
jgi:hypothetical protein